MKLSGEVSYRRNNGTRRNAGEPERVLVGVHTDSWKPDLDQGQEVLSPEGRQSMGESQQSIGLWSGVRAVRRRVRRERQKRERISHI